MSGLAGAVRHGYDLFSAAERLRFPRRRFTVPSWHPGMSTGVPELDYQHKELIARFNHIQGVDARLNQFVPPP
jgi:hypothetical protein